MCCITQMKNCESEEDRNEHNANSQVPQHHPHVEQVFMTLFVPKAPTSHRRQIDGIGNERNQANAQDVHQSPGRDRKRWLSPCSLLFSPHLFFILHSIDLITTPQITQFIPSFTGKATILVVDRSPVDETTCFVIGSKLARTQTCEFHNSRIERNRSS